MKRLTAALAGGLLLSACGMADPEKAALAQAAIAQVQALNAAGIDPVSLDADKLALLAAGCALAPALYPLRAAEIAATCAVIQEAAK